MYNVLLWPANKTQLKPLFAKRLLDLDQEEKTHFQFGFEQT